LCDCIAAAVSHGDVVGRNIDRDIYEWSARAIGLLRDATEQNRAADTDGDDDDACEEDDAD